LIGFLTFKAKSQSKKPTKQSSVSRGRLVLLCTKVGQGSAASARHETDLPLLGTNIFLSASQTGKSTPHGLGLPMDYYKYRRTTAQSVAGENTEKCHRSCAPHGRLLPTKANLFFYPSQPPCPWWAGGSRQSALRHCRFPRRRVLSVVFSSIGKRDEHTFCVFWEMKNIQACKAVLSSWALFDAGIARKVTCCLFGPQISLFSTYTSRPHRTVLLVGGRRIVRSSSGHGRRAVGGAAGRAPGPPWLDGGDATAAHRRWLRRHRTTRGELARPLPQ